MSMQADTCAARNQMPDYFSAVVELRLTCAAHASICAVVARAQAPCMYSNSRVPLPPRRRHSPSRGQERSRPSSPNGHAASYGRKGSRRSPDRRHASPQRSRRSPERRRSRSPERRRHTDHQRSHHRPASPHQHQRHNASPGRRRESSRERARERQYTSSHARLRSRSRDRERQPPSRRDSGIGACSSMGEVTDLRQLLNRKRVRRLVQHCCRIASRACLYLSGSMVACQGALQVPCPLSSGLQYGLMLPHTFACCTGSAHNARATQARS